MKDTKVVGTTLSGEQLQIIDNLRSAHGMAYNSQVIREALKMYVESHNIEWPEYTFVDNEMRQRLKIRP